MSLDVLSSEVISDTERFTRELRDRYLQEPVVHSEFLDKSIGGDRFGQLRLICGRGGCLSQSEGMKRSWDMLRGNVDNVTNVSEKIDIQDVLHVFEPPIKVVVDGPPGVGKTTLCKKLCNMWAKNELKKRSFDHVFLLPLRDERVTSAEKMYDLVSLFHGSKKLCEAVSDHIMETNGKDTLLIFDGWDEFEGRNKDRSFILDIIRGKHPLRCSTMVTSRAYASADLHEMRSFNRHIEVLGFEESEIFSYIKKELTEEKSEQLVMKLKTREDVLSICYIPFVCSMLVRVYHLFDYTLPNTLTALYRKFIIYAMKRSMNRPGFNPRRIESLDNLQEDQKAFDELCYCAYVNLQKGSTNFTEDQIQSYKCKHFGLMTSYNIADTTRYQFLHLTIQEFLAAWWISQQDDLKTLFGEHFQDIHFRMTLMFVAGLTELKDDSYQEYFSKEVDLQCVKRPLFGFEFHQHSMFHKNPQILNEDIWNIGNEYPLHEPYDIDTIQLLHLLYESQNKTLCQVLASSIKDSSLCLNRVYSSEFDLLCLSFFLKNSKKTWNYLDFGYFEKLKTLKIEDEGSDMIHCTAMKTIYQDFTSPIKMLQSSLCQLQECYINILYPSDDIRPHFMFIQLFQLPQLSILHVNIKLRFDEPEEHIDYAALSEMENVMYTNHNIKELSIDLCGMSNWNTLIKSLLTGVKQNDAILFFSLSSVHAHKSWLFEGSFDESPHIELLQFQDIFKINQTPQADELLFEGRFDESPCNPLLQIQDLLESNQTLQAVKLNIPLEGAQPSHIIQVSKSLTALNISNIAIHDIVTYPVKKTETLSPGLENGGRNITNLKSLSLYKPLISLSNFFNSNLFLQHLDIIINEEKLCDELFTFLCSNTTITALRIRYEAKLFMNKKTGESLQLMLSSNQRLQSFAIESTGQDYRRSNIHIPINHLSGCLRDNNTLQELAIEFDGYLHEIFDASDNLKVLAVSTSCSYISEHVTSLVTDMLKRNVKIQFLKVSFPEYTKGSQSSDIFRYDDMIKVFLETVLLHPSLRYINVVYRGSFRMYQILNDMKETLLTKRKQKKLGPPPIVNTEKL